MPRRPVAADPNQILDHVRLQQPSSRRRRIFTTPSKRYSKMPSKTPLNDPLEDALDEAPDDVLIHLLEADIFGVLMEALTAHVQTVFTDQTVTVAAGSA